MADATDTAVPGSDGLGGRPGDRWRNHTSDVWYQLVSSLRKPCAACIRKHGRILPRPWPIPIHPHCECDQIAIPPGADAPIEFRRPDQLVTRLDVAAQKNLVGDSILKLVDAGVVRWADVVGDEDFSLLTFAELVKRSGLTVEVLERAGIDPAAAERAVGAGPLAPAAGRP